MTYQGCFYYGSEPEVWFGRSGAIVVIWGGMAESLLAVYGIGSIIQGITEPDVVAFKSEQKLLISLGQYSGAFIVVAGTLIWGYGDLLYLYLRT